jgi:hypothetical protein
MSLDEAHHRLIVGAWMPPRLLVFDTENGKHLASAELAVNSDDLFYDAAFENAITGRPHSAGFLGLRRWLESKPRLQLKAPVVCGFGKEAAAAGCLIGPAKQR